MSSNPLRRLLSRTLALATLAVAGLGSAQATYVVGEWDPAYGAPFTNLGWRGTTTLDVDGSCLLAPGTVINNGFSCPLMTVVSATVELYDITNSLVTLDVLNFTSLVSLDYLVVDINNLALGFGLSPTGQALSTTPLAITGSLQASFSLQVDYFAFATATMYWSTAGGSGQNDAINFPTEVTVTTVPEPASLALVLLALLTLAGVATATGRCQA